jgi:hypothetical protein
MVDSFPCSRWPGYTAAMSPSSVKHVLLPLAVLALSSISALGDGQKPDQPAKVHISPASDAAERRTTVTLAQSGRPAATIVIPVHPSDRVSLAATELQSYVRKICGVELPIHRDGKAVTGTGLYIGRCEPTQESDLPSAGLNPETYAIHCRQIPGANLEHGRTTGPIGVFLTGRYPTGTYFAVTSFIESVLGVRWFAPGIAWEYLPPAKAGDLTVTVHDEVKAPDVSPRFWSGHNFADSWVTWGLRNKTVNSERAPRKSFQNNLHTIFPPSKYASTHREYYPLIDGKRWIPEPGYRYWRPCESNPEVLRLTVEAARKHFDTHPDSDSFSVGMDDIAFMCGCPKCRSMDPHPDSYEKREFADRHYKFVNAVAREVARTHPDRYIGTLIYAIARKPPQTADRLEDNVFGFITEESAMWFLPGHKEADHALTREWARRCRHLSRYDYFGLGTFTPRYYPHFMAEQIKFDKSVGVEGMYSELNTFLPHTAPMIWSFAKLEWDASLNIDDLLNEFMTKMFGRAAPAMAKYYDHLEQSWIHGPPGHTAWEHRNIFMQAMAITPEAVDQGLKLLDQAESRADQPIVRERIGMIRAALQYAGYAINEYSLSEKIIAAPVITARQADTTRNDCLALMNSMAQREPLWAAAIQRNDLFGENLRGLANKGYLMVGRVANLDRGAGIGALRVLDWYGEHDLSRLPEVTRQLTQSARCDSAEALRAWLLLQRKQDEPLPNLLENPGFEHTVSSTPSNSGTALPAGWSTYSISGTTRFGREEEAGRHRTAAGSLSRAHSASFYQRHEVKPGERYLCTVWVNSRPVNTDAYGYLSVRFQKPDGSWHSRGDLEPQLSMVAQAGWQPLMVVVRIPEGAGNVVLLIGAKDQRDDVTVLFDDAGLYRLPNAW